MFRSCWENTKERGGSDRKSPTTLLFIAGQIHFAGMKVVLHGSPLPTTLPCEPHGWKLSRQSTASESTVLFPFHSATSPMWLRLTHCYCSEEFYSQAGLNITKQASPTMDQSPEQQDREDKTLFWSGKVWQLSLHHWSPSWQKLCWWSSRAISSSDKKMAHHSQVSKIHSIGFWPQIWRWDSDPKWIQGSEVNLEYFVSQPIPLLLVFHGTQHLTRDLIKHGRDGKNNLLMTYQRSLCQECCVELITAQACPSPTFWGSQWSPSLTQLRPVNHFRL